MHSVNDSGFSRCGEDRLRQSFVFVSQFNDLFHSKLILATQQSTSSLLFLTTIAFFVLSFFLDTQL